MESSLRSTELADVVLTADRDVLIVASGGAGKSTLLNAIGGSGAISVVDDADQLSVPAIRALIDLLNAPDRPRVAIAGRTIPGDLWNATSAPTILRETDLWYTTAHVATVLGPGADDRLVTDVARFTSGWPAAVHALSEAGIAHAPSPLTIDEVADQPARIGVTGDRWLDTLSADDAWAVGVLCSIGRFDQRSAELLDATDPIARAVRNGLPLCRDHIGWTTLPPVGLRALLESITLRGPAGEHPLQISTRTQEKRLIECMVHLDRAGELEQCVDFCLRAGRNDLAALMLSRQPHDVCERADSESLRAQLVLLEPSYEQHPALALSAVEVGQRLGDPDQIRRSLEAAMRGVDERDSSLSEPISQEIAAELAFQLSVLGDNERAAVCVTRLEAADVEPVSPAGARLLEAKVGLSLLEMTPDSLLAARSSLTEAIAIWRQLGRNTRAAESTRRLVGSVMRNLGLTHDAIRLLERALADQLPEREVAVLQLARGRFLAEVGRLSDAATALDLAATVAADATGPQVAAQASEGLANLASLAGDAPQVRAHYDQLCSAIGPWRSTRHGAHLLGQIAVSFARVDDIEMARALIDEVRAMEHADEREVGLYGAMVTAYTSPGPVAIDEVETFIAAVPVPPAAQWITMFSLALAHRATEPDRARALLAEASELSLSTSGTDKPRLIEHRYFGMISDGAESTASPIPAPTWSIQVLDGFAVVVDGDLVATPRGRQATLIKFLVLSRGYCTLDSAIDALWPEIDLVMGRRRLRNVLSRIRASMGDVIQRDDQLLRLPSGVTSDIATLRIDAAAVLADPDPSPAAVASVRHRLAAELLPMNRYDEWLEPFESELRSTRQKWVERYSNARADEPSGAGAPAKAAAH